MKKTTILSSLLWLAVCTCTMTLSSCGDDDDNSTNEIPTPSGTSQSDAEIMKSLAGKYWIYTRTRTRYINDTETSRDNDTYPDMNEDYIQLTENGICTYMEYSSSNGTHHEDGVMTFNVKNGKIVFGNTGEAERVTVHEATSEKLDVEIWWQASVSNGTKSQKADRIVAFKRAD